MRSIVVGLQGNRDVEPALRFALDEAVRRRLPLQVVHAYPVPRYGEVTVALLPGHVRSLRDEAERVAQAALESAKDVVPGGHTVQATLTVMEGHPLSCLLSFADTAALVVVGSRGFGPFERAIRGSVSAGCLHRCPGPVAVVPDGTGAPADRWLRSRVVVGLDGSRASLSALSWATSQAREWGSTLVPVVVLGRDDLPPPALRDGNNLTALVWRLVSEAGSGDLEIHPRWLRGHPSTQLRGAVGPDDLLALGSRGRGGAIELLAGSTSMPVAESAPCPVVVVQAGQARREIHQRRAQPAEL